MKKLASIIVVICLVFSLTACGSEPAGTTKAPENPVTTKANEGTTQAPDTTTTPAKTTDYPTKDITLYCGYAAGGGSDVSMRLLVPYLEAELGVNVNVVNVTGGGGFVCWLQVLDEPADGYSISQINFPGLLAGILNPDYDYGVTLDSFKFICNQTSDSDCLVINAKDDRFSTIEEFIDYAQKNGIISGDGGIGSNKHLASLAFARQWNLQMESIHQKGWSETYASILGGTVDVGWATIPECKAAVEDGELKVLCTFAKERNQFAPDVPTYNELNLGGSILTGQYRGFMCSPNVPDDVYQIICDAFAKASQNPEYLQKIADMSYTAEYLTGDELRAGGEAMYDMIMSFSKELGWEK